MSKTFWIAVRGGELAPLLTHLGSTTVGKLKRGSLRMSVGEIGGGWNVLWCSDMAKELVDISYLCRHADEGELLVVISSSVSEMTYLQYLQEGDCVWELNASPGRKLESLLLEGEEDIEGDQQLFVECVSAFFEEGGACGYEVALRFLSAFMERNGAKIEDIPGSEWKPVDLKTHQVGASVVKKRTAKQLQKELGQIVKDYATQNGLYSRKGVDCVLLVTGEEAYLRVYPGIRQYRHELRNFEFEFGISNELSMLKDGDPFELTFWDLNWSVRNSFQSKWVAMAEGITRGENAKDHFDSFLADVTSCCQHLPVWRSINDVKTIVDQWSLVPVPELANWAIRNATSSEINSVPGFPELEFATSARGWATLYFSSIYSLASQDQIDFHIERVRELLNMEPLEVPPNTTMKQANSIFSLFGYSRIKLAEKLAKYLDLSDISIRYFSIPREKYLASDPSISLYLGEAEIKVHPSFPKPSSRLTRIINHESLPIHVSGKKEAVGKCWRNLSTDRGDPIEVQTARCGCGTRCRGCRLPEGFE